MITITGGKLTTWRRMAKMTVDRIVERDARDAPCRTHEIQLGQAIAPQELPRVEGVPARLLRRRSPPATATPPREVLALAAERGELAQPIVEGLPDLLAEVALAARREQARSIGDVLLRRTRLGLLAARELTGGQAPGEEPAQGGGEEPEPVRRVGEVLRARAPLEPRAARPRARGLRRGGSRRGAPRAEEPGARVEEAGLRPPAAMP